MSNFHHACRALVYVAFVGVAVPVAHADEMSKEACVDAHSRGQDAKEAGKLSLARKLFLQCAQSSCPGVVQGDCARFADDLTRMQPTIAFAARDTAGNDLPDTTVYLDELLVVTRLDDGKPHDLDPGKHTVKFSNAGRDVTVTVVIGTGEKGRTIVGTFPALGGPPTSTGGAARMDAPPAKPKPVTLHPAGARVAMIGGALLTVGGTAFAVWGMTSMPSNCKLSTHECAAPPGDPAFDKAHSAAMKLNLGIAAGGIGAAVLVGGLIWYMKGAHTQEQMEASAFAPYVTPDGGGFAVSGRF
jgi:hypothetical protein